MSYADIAGITLKSSEASEYSNIQNPHNINLYYNKCGDCWPISSSDFYQLFFNSKDCLFKEFSLPKPMGFCNNGDIKYTKFPVSKNQKQIENMLTLYEWYYCSYSKIIEKKKEEEEEEEEEET